MSELKRYNTTMDILHYLLYLFTILLHVAAALYRQFILKDSLLSRMSLRKV